MDKICCKRMVWLAAVILWMMVIFSFSNQKAVQSAQTSGSISSRVVEEINQVFHLGWQEEEIRICAGYIEHPIRKAAHMTEYAILAGLFFGNCIQYAVLKYKAYLWAFLGTAGYAATDEFHQLFIDGRSGEIKDVCIDSLGGMLALIAIGLFMYRRKRNKK